MSGESRIHPSSGPVRRRRRRALGMAFSLAAHGLILAALFLAPVEVLKPPFEPPAVTVALLDGRSLAPAPTPPAEPAPPSPKPPTPPKPAVRAPKKPVVKPVARRHRVRSPAASADVESASAEDAPIAVANPELSAAQLAGAASAGDGPPGGPCDMAGRLQQALRRDRLVHASVANYAGKAIKVWDGEWVWMPGDIGQGLTAVRQAMIWEIAYAPKDCRSQPMHGLVVFSVSGARGPVRLAVGEGDWRWTDLLASRSGGAWARP